MTEDASRGISLVEAQTTPFGETTVKPQWLKDRAERAGQLLEAGELPPDKLQELTDRKREEMKDPMYSPTDGEKRVALSSLVVNEFVNGATQEQIREAITILEKVPEPKTPVDGLILGAFLAKLEEDKRSASTNDTITTADGDVPVRVIQGPMIPGREDTSTQPQEKKLGELSKAQRKAILGRHRAEMGRELPKRRDTMIEPAASKSEETAVIPATDTPEPTLRPTPVSTRSSVDLAFLGSQSAIDGAATTMGASEPRSAVSTTPDASISPSVIPDAKTISSDASSPFTRLDKSPGVTPADLGITPADSEELSQKAIDAWKPAEAAWAERSRQIERTWDEARQAWLAGIAANNAEPITDVPQVMDRLKNAFKPLERLQLKHKARHVVGAVGIAAIATLGTPGVAGDSGVAVEAAMVQPTTIMAETAQHIGQNEQQEIENIIKFGKEITIPEGSYISKEVMGLSPDEGGMQPEGFNLDIYTNHPERAIALLLMNVEKLMANTHTSESDVWSYIEKAYNGDETAYQDLRHMLDTVQPGDQITVFPVEQLDMITALVKSAYDRGGATEVQRVISQLRAGYYVDDGTLSNPVDADQVNTETMTAPAGTSVASQLSDETTSAPTVSAVPAALETASDAQATLTTDSNLHMPPLSDQAGSAAAAAAAATAGASLWARGRRAFRRAITRS